MTDDLLTLAEVARYLRVSKTSVYSWAQAGNIPAGKVGKQWRFSKRKISRWWMTRRQRPNDNRPVQERSRATALAP